MQNRNANESETTLESTDSIASLLKSVGAQKEVFLAIIESCREKRKAADIDQHIAPLLEYRKSVYTPDVMRKLLRQSGALAYLDAESSGESDDQHSGDTDAVHAENAPEGEPSYDEDGNLVLREKPEGFWLATGEALAYLDSLDPAAELAAIVQDDKRYSAIYRRILVFCAERGRTVSEISRLVDDDPLLEGDQRQSGYFIGKLEDAGALAWKGHWLTTDVGKTLLDEEEAA